MINRELESFLSFENIDYDSQVDLKKKTWIHRGGVANYFIKPNNSKDLQKIMSFIYNNDLPHILFGSTSNLYVLNSTNIPIVVSTLKCSSFMIKREVIECECGVQVSKLAKQMIEQGIKGFEYLTKLPGTIGAAIYNNSTVKSPQNSITNLLIDVDIATPSGVLKMKAKDFNFSFRSSDLKKHLIQGTILRARLKKELGDVKEMRQIAQENEAERMRILEGPAQNLGCTVHKPFCNGQMPLQFRILNSIFSRIIRFCVKDTLKQKKNN